MLLEIASALNTLLQDHRRKVRQIIKGFKIKAKVNVLIFNNLITKLKQRRIISCYKRYAYALANQLR